MTALNVNRQGPRRLALLGMAIGLLCSLPAMAGNVLQQVRYDAAPDGKVDIRLEFAEPVEGVQAFTTDSPPRIAIDLPETTSALAERRVIIGSGATSAVSAAESNGRTRVVVDLFRPADYETRVDGNALIVTVDGLADVATLPANASPLDPSKRLPATAEVSAIDFRRGDNGAGQIIVRFNDEGAIPDMRTEGDRIVVDVANAAIPEALRQRLDVVDFATPVRTIDARSNAGGTRMVIATEGEVQSLAYQTGNEYVIEVGPVASAQGAAAGATVPGNEPVYVGPPVTFNFQDIPVRTLLQVIAEYSGLNIVAADSVSGNVTLRLTNVPYDQALDIVLRAKGLDKRIEGNVIWVAPQEELATYEQAREDARIALEVRAELITEYIPINYGNAEEIAKLLTEESKSTTQGGGDAASASTRGFLSQRGSVSFDRRTNTLLVSDIPSKVREIRDLIAVLDRPVDQVLIEARIVIATETFARDIGARFGVMDRSNRPLSGTVDDAFASTGTNPADPTTTSGGGFLASNPLATTAGSFALSILTADALIDMELQLLQEEGRGEVISNPRVITSNQREATIRQGEEIGYVTLQAAQQGQAPQFTVEFKEVVLELKVTPTITQDGRVFMDMTVLKDEVEGFTETATYRVPNISTREVQTAVLVDSAQTVVIGGVYEFRNRDDFTKVPWLGDLPVLGNMFRSRSRSTDKAELLIFVTPRIIPVASRAN